MWETILYWSAQLLEIRIPVIQQHNMESSTGSDEDSSLFTLTEPTFFIVKNKNNSSSLIGSAFVGAGSHGTSAAAYQSTSGDWVVRGML